MRIISIILFTLLSSSIFGQFGSDNLMVSDIHSSNITSIPLNEVDLLTERISVMNDSSFKIDNICFSFSKELFTLTQDEFVTDFNISLNNLSSNNRIFEFSSDTEQFSTHNKFIGVSDSEGLLIYIGVGGHFMEIQRESILAIPTMSEWGLIILFLLLLIFGVVAIRQAHNQVQVD